MSENVASKRTGIVAKFAIGMIVGGVGGYVGAATVDGLNVDIGIADGIGLFVALVLVLTGGWLLLAASGTRAYRAMGPDKQSEAPDDAMLSMARLQALTNIAAGVVFAIPSLAGGLDEGTRVALYAAILAVIAVETALNVMIWRRSDELLRSVIIQSGAICFWIFQGLLFLYAAAEKLGLAAPIDSWTIMVALMGLYVVAGSWLAIRRGLASG